FDRIGQQVPDHAVDHITVAVSIHLIGFGGVQHNAFFICKGSASAPLLYHRFNEEIVDRLEIAVNTEEEMEKLRSFRSRLPKIGEKLQAIPLYVHNSNLTRNNTVRGRDGGILIISWSSWTLEPLGAGLPHRLRKKTLPGLLEMVRGARKDIRKDLTSDDILMAAWCFDLENLMNKKRYKGALQMIDKMPGYETTDS
ncbi:MAG: hypothetical protein R6U13_07660, partial [Desulfatiglandaceae bacterium]